MLDRRCSNGGPVFGQSREFGRSRFDGPRGPYSPNGPRNMRGHPGGRFAPYGRAQGFGPFDYDPSRSMSGNVKGFGPMPSEEELASMTGHSVRMRGLPFSATTEDVSRFLAPLQAVNIKIFYTPVSNLIKLIGFSLVDLQVKQSLILAVMMKQKNL